MFFKRVKLFLILTVFLSLLSVSSSVVAADAPTPESNATAIADKSVALDTVWTMLAGMLVMFMQAGFAMVESGFTRAKNACNVLMKNLMDFSIGSIIYWAIGFGIMFGSGNMFFGTTGFFLSDVGNAFSSLDWTSVPLECKYFFQMVFAATAATIVSGAMAERTKFKAYLIFSVVVSAIIYPVVGHWIWGGGWLSSFRYVGFCRFYCCSFNWSLGGVSWCYNVRSTFGEI